MSQASTNSWLDLKVPPVAITLLSALAMWLVASAAPALDFDIALRKELAALVLLTGAGISMGGVLAFRRAQTTVSPLSPQKTSRLVVSGIYRYSRNPMYLGFAMLLLGWALWLSNFLALAVLPAFVAAINRLQIAPEEAALARLFGADFLAYKARTRRWL